MYNKYLINVIKTWIFMNFAKVACAYNGLKIVQSYGLYRCIV